jgi:hypothetical protein
MTSDSLKAGSDASDAIFWTSKAFAMSDQSLRDNHTQRFNDTL